MEDLSRDRDIPDAVKLALVSIKRNSLEDIQISFSDLKLQDEISIHTQDCSTPQLEQVTILSDKSGRTAGARLTNPDRDPTLEGPRARPRGSKGARDPKGAQQPNRLEEPK